VGALGTVEPLGLVVDDIERDDGEARGGAGSDRLESTCETGLDTRRVGQLDAGRSERGLSGGVVLLVATCENNERQENNRTEEGLTIQS
jgi:hypothetical protein